MGFMDIRAMTNTVFLTMSRLSLSSSSPLESQAKITKRSAAANPASYFNNKVDDILADNRSFFDLYEPLAAARAILEHVLMPTCAIISSRALDLYSSQICCRHVVAR